jgi:hypothetical protein
MTDSKAEFLLAQVCHAGTEQSRLSKAKELRIDQNQCRRLKYYYGLDCPQGTGVGTLTESRTKWDYGVGTHSTPMKWATARAFVPWPLFIPQ